MGIVEATGIITREVKYGDSSRILTILTEELGKISVLAGGVRSNKSGLLTATQLFSYGEFNLFKSREKSLYKINNGATLNSFSGLRGSLTQMAYASYFCEIANSIIQEESPDPEQLRLLLNALFMLQDEKLPLEQIKAVYEFRTLAIQGLLPPLNLCSVCGEAESLTFFKPAENSALCKKCADKEVSTVIETGTSILGAISYISNAEPKKIFAFRLSDNSLSYLSRLGEYCLELHLEKHLKTLDYLKNVMSLED